MCGSSCSELHFHVQCIFISLSTAQCVHEGNNVWSSKIKLEVYFNDEFHYKSKGFTIASLGVWSGVFFIRTIRTSLCVWTWLLDFKQLSSAGLYFMCVYTHHTYVSLCLLISSGHMSLAKNQWKHSECSCFMQPADNRILMTVCLSWATLTTEKQKKNSEFYFTASTVGKTKTAERKQVILQPKLELHYKNRTKLPIWSFNSDYSNLEIWKTQKNSPNSKIQVLLQDRDICAVRTFFHNHWWKYF